MKANVWFFRVLTVSLCVLSLVACSSAVAAPVVHLRYALESHPGQAENLCSDHWAELVKQYSNGEIEIEMFPSAVLGNADEALEQLVMGTVDLNMKGTGLLGGLVPAYNILYLPYRWKDVPHLHRFLATEEYQNKMLIPLREKGVRVIGHWARSPRHLMTRDLVVKQASDVQGLMLRVPTSRASHTVWQALGCSTQTISNADLYTAMQQGIVDGMEAPADALLGNSAPEVLHQLSLTAHVCDVSLVMISEKVYQNLSPEHREIMERASEETQKWSEERALRVEKELLDMFVEEYKVTITQPDVASFMTATAGVVKDLTEELSPGMDEFIRSLENN